MARGEVLLNRRQHVADDELRIAPVGGPEIDRHGGVHEAGRGEGGALFGGGPELRAGIAHPVGVGGPQLALDDAQREQARLQRVVLYVPACPRHADVPVSMVCVAGLGEDWTRRELRSPVHRQGSRRLCPQEAAGDGLGAVRADMLTVEVDLAGGGGRLHVGNGKERLGVSGRGEVLGRENALRRAAAVERFHHHLGVAREAWPLDLEDRLVALLADPLEESGAGDQLIVAVAAPAVVIDAHQRHRTRRRGEGLERCRGIQRGACGGLRPREVERRFSTDARADLHIARRWRVKGDAVVAPAGSQQLGALRLRDGILLYS